MKQNQQKCRNPVQRNPIASGMHLRYTSKPYTDKKRQWKKDRDDTLEDSVDYHEQEFEDENIDDDFS